MPTQDDKGRAQSDSQRAHIDSTRAGTDSTRALVDSGKAGTDSTRAQEDSDRAASEVVGRDRKAKERLYAWVFFGIITALAMWYVQGIAQEAHDVATDFAASEEAEDLEEQQEQIDNCKARNTAIRNGRNRVGELLNGVEFVLNRNEDDPEEIAENAEIVQELRRRTLGDPEEEDLDCNEDGGLTEEDYAP